MASMAASCQGPRPCRDWAARGASLMPSIILDAVQDDDEDGEMAAQRVGASGAVRPLAMPEPEPEREPEPAMSGDIAA